MVGKYRLIYFNVTGLAEPIRYLLAYGKIPFEDCRLEYEDWIKYKPRTPFGQIPVLEIDGKLYNQTTAICRYFSKQLGLVGKTDKDALRIDAVVDTITDFRMNYANYFKIETDDGRREKLNEIKLIHNPYYFSKFEEIVSENGGHFINNQLTWADIFFAGLSELWIKLADEPILNNYPGLKNLKKKIENLPDIKTYREKRPDTLF